MSRSEEIPSGPRRQSFMDYGGPNSLHNFASSVQRALTYLETTLPGPAGADLSPCTSRESPGESDLELALLDTENVAATNTGYGSNALLKARAIMKPDLSRFHFPNDTERQGLLLLEHASLLNSSLNRTRRESSFGATVPGRSTAPQTVFNAVNTLMGVAMLSLPFAFRLSGWVMGLVILLACAWTTSQTAKVLGKVLLKHRTVHSYADIAYLYGGRKFLAFATATFTVDLLGALLSLILIFSDSFSMLFPSVHGSVFKLMVTAITFVFLFLPLRLVSLISLLGIVCTVGIFVSIALCGFTASTVPGSLLHPTQTSLWPSSLPNLLLSLGIFMAPWGGHPVFPELYRDMRHPAKYEKSCTVTFLVTVVLDLLIAAVGYLMFGNGAGDSITKNIIANSQYPHWIRSTICVFLGVLPVCKLALVTRPVISVYESQLSLARNGQSTNARPQVSLGQVVARVVFMAFLFSLSIAFTSFGKVVAFLGSAICFTICVTLPLLFHLRLNKDDLTPVLEAFTKAGVAVGVLGAILGTYGSFASEI